jgi:phospholipid/cholesterol/gamma-HCH transport system substrate-binding protein
MKNIFQMAEFKVGMLVFSVAILIGVMSMRVSDDPTVGGAKTFWFLSPNANGLVKQSTVKMAGIPVGIIKDIQLQAGIAKIEITVRDEVDIRKSAVAEIKANGILGDKYVEITPGSLEDPLLEKGGQIIIISDKGSMDSVMSKVGEIATSLGSVAKSLQEAVENDGTNKHILGRIVQNIDRVAGDLAQITGENKQQIREIVQDIRSIAKNIDGTLSDQKSGLKVSWARLDKSLKNIEEITGKVNDGKGTIGKLINDEKTVDEINTAVEGINGFLDASNKLSTALDFHSEYLGGRDAWKSYIGLKLQPGLDRYYMIQIIDDPAGVKDSVNTVSTVKGGTTTEVDQTSTYKNKIKLSAQFAKNFYNFTVRGGLIENSGGVGFDMQFWKRKFLFSLEAYEFSNVNVRTALKYNVYKGIYVTGGVSDALNKSNNYSNYIGAGLFLTNDDMKILMTKMPF